MDWLRVRLMVEGDWILAGIELGRLVISATSAHVPLRGTSVCVGRCPRKSQLVISGTTISRCHCQFTLEGGRIYVEDLNSLNGTWLNGTRITRARVTDQTILHLGSEQLMFEQSLRFGNWANTVDEGIALASEMSSTRFSA